MSRRSRYLLVLAVCLIILLLFFRGCGHAGGNRGDRGGREVPVGVAQARVGDMPIYLRGIGTVKPLNTVTVRSRVDGTIDRIAFTEGQLVNAGDLLVQIDPRPFEVQLAQAQAQLAKDEAALKNSEVELSRERKAAEAIPRQQIDTQAALVDQNQAALKIDEAQIDAAKLQLDYSHVVAPLAGRIGLKAVDEGNIIHASDANGVAVITQLQPISVVFTLPQDDIQELTNGMRAQSDPLTADAYDRDLKNKLATGQLAALDNQIDQTSGTLRLKANFENRDTALFPNQFVNIRLLVRTVHAAVIVPNAAIQRGPDSTFVYVIDNSDNTVHMHKVTVGPVEGENTVIENGVADGDTVVISGVDKLQDGGKVTIGDPDAAESSSSANGSSSSPGTRHHRDGKGAQ